MKANQENAIRKLQAELLSCKRAGIVLVGCEGTLMTAERSEPLQNAFKATSSVEAVAAWPEARIINDYGCYLDSGSGA